MLLLVLVCALALLAQANPAAARAERKLEHIRQNGQRAHPDPTPTVLSEQEINAWFASGGVALPKGVQHVRFRGSNGTITTTARVDFDKLTQGARSANPLLALFTGVHDVSGVALASGHGGQGVVHVQAVSLDGMEIPRMALQFFVDRYLKPKYPEVGLDSTFRMPDKIQTATVGEHVLTVVQR